MPASWAGGSQKSRPCGPRLRERFRLLRRPTRAGEDSRFARRRQPCGLAASPGLGYRGRHDQPGPRNAPRSATRWPPSRCSFPARGNDASTYPFPSAPLVRPPSTRGAPRCQCRTGSTSRTPPSICLIERGLIASSTGRRSGARQTFVTGTRRSSTRWTGRASGGSSISCLPSGYPRSRSGSRLPPRQTSTSSAF